MKDVCVLKYFDIKTDNTWSILTLTDKKRNHCIKV